MIAVSAIITERVRCLSFIVSINSKNISSASNSEMPSQRERASSKTAFVKTLAACSVVMNLVNKPLQASIQCQNVFKGAAVQSTHHLQIQMAVDKNCRHKRDYLFSQETVSTQLC